MSLNDTIAKNLNFFYDVRNLNPNDKILDQQYIKGVLLMMLRFNIREENIIPPIQAYRIILPLIQSINNRNLNIQNSLFDKLFKLISAEFSFSFSEGFGKLLIDTNVIGIDESIVEKNFYWDIHRNFAEKDTKILGLLMIKKEPKSPLINTRRLQFVRPLYYVLMRLYFPTNQKILELSNILLSKKIKWSEVPYTNIDPKIKFKKIKNKLSNIENVYYLYAVKFIYDVFTKTNSEITALFPIQAINKFKTFPPKPKRLTKKDLKELEKIAILFTEKFKDLEISKSMKELLLTGLDSNLKLIEIDWKEFNPFYTTGFKLEFDRMKKLLKKQIFINDMESEFISTLGKIKEEFSHRQYLEQQFILLNLSNPFDLGNFNFWKDIHNSYRIKQRFVPDKNLKFVNIFTQNSKDLIKSVKEKGLSTNLEKIFKEKLKGINGEIIISDDETILQNKLNILEINTIEFLIIVYLESGTFIRSPNTNFYIAIKENSNLFNIILINIDDTTVFPNHLISITEKITSKLNIKNGIKSKTFQTATNVLETEYPIDNYLLYGLWYSECIIRGISQKSMFHITDIFGKKLESWILKNYFEGVQNLIDLTITSNMK